MKSFLIIIVALSCCIGCENRNTNQNVPPQSPNQEPAPGRFQLYIDTSISDPDTGKKAPVLFLLDTVTGELFFSKDHPATGEWINFTNGRPSIPLMPMNIWERRLQIVDQSTEDRLKAMRAAEYKAVIPTKK